MVKQKFHVTVRICDHVQHEGWVSREEIFDSFDIESDETDTMRTAHAAIRERHPNSEHSFSVLINKHV